MEDMLIGKEKWKELIDSLRSKEVVSDKNETKKILKEKLISAVEKRIPQEKFGIFFSGGVDSTLIAAICKSLKKNFICYAVGFQDDKTKEPEDLLEAKKAAQELGFELKYKLFNLEEAEEIIKKTIDILKKEGKTDVVNVGVGAVVLAAAELGKKDGMHFFFSGLGSEEIFAGYERHSNAEDVQKESWNGLKQMWDRDLVRDNSLSKSLGITIKTPFLDQELIKLAMKLPTEWKIDSERKKIILREVAEEFLGKFAWRKKKAAQYGSCFDKAISKLAKKSGKKYKKEIIKDFT